MEKHKGKIYCLRCKYYCPPESMLLIPDRCTSNPERIETYLGPRGKCASPEEKNKNNNCSEFKLYPSWGRKFIVWLFGR